MYFSPAFVDPLFEGPGDTLLLSVCLRRHPTVQLSAPPSFDSLGRWRFDTAAFFVRNLLRLDDRVPEDVPVVIFEEFQPVDPVDVGLDGGLGVVELVAADGADVELLVGHNLAVLFSVGL